MKDRAPDGPADWYRDAIIYQLHVKSFADSNGDGIGDFSGLLGRLDYVAELGATAIWLLPFYPSPRRDDGYDISDYRRIHPDYGTMADFRRLVRAAHERGLRVITELVINHTSDQHPWFQRARRAKPGSAARNLYVWSDSDGRYAGTRIIFTDTEVSNWTWDPVAGAYFWHRFYAHQPDLNFDNPRVLASVVAIMRFWLDLGVDGLRLDAVPYLIEREGTSSENLPETHAVLKRLRAELDRSHPGRMLLAEANQWPEDTRPYFGDGDECNMAFHFPLMPRMYMAIAQEDRFPITDILRQTPDIPAGCQWAIFLRNHDELTLEMVTDSERDFLWTTYAPDSRARLNLGIRRRLSPLLERDRRRLELMNGLLLSMPGTPVLYYGDEIGMGDNIHLGDRDGVRTPMQWSPDRNGGFSRADAERLVLPAITNPLYGYGAVNVEAQEADPHSLLNWTRRLLAVRRTQPAFGRGAFESLAPRNRKVLAFLRLHEERVVLCVSNLARTAQAVELDLSAYAGRTPVDLLGGSAFPPIGQLPYLLTLPPYAFYWFTLSAEPGATAAPEALPEHRTFVLQRAIDEVLQGAARPVLERSVLPLYLAARRWFAAKDRRIAAVRFGAAAALEHGGHRVLLAPLVATFDDGGTETYALPLAIAWDDETVGPLPGQLALARIRRGRRVGFLTDGFATEALPRAVLALLARNAAVPSEAGELRFEGTPALAGLALPADAPVRHLGVEQSNSALVIGDAAVLKLLRRPAPGIHPEIEMTGHLTARGFASTPPLLGVVERAGEGACSTVMVLQGFVRNQGDAWGWMQEFLARTTAELAVAPAEAPPERAAPEGAALAGMIGQRLAELHALLAAPSDDPAFAPETAGAEEARAWAAEVSAQFDAALAALAGVELEGAAMLRGRAGAVRRSIAGLAAAARGALKTRIHGDFHLGQVLVAEGDAWLIDFEGEPARSLEQRRAKASPLRDVAGLLRSLDYARAVAAPGRAALPPSAEARRPGLLDRLHDEAASAFLAAYRRVHAAAPVPWVPPEAEARLLDLFLLQKAAYELCYEAANRPDWIPIPLAGLAAMAGRLAGGDGDA
jgi:maltose alpha-D-glucosyltransferase/alpha-amylase